MAQYSLSPNFLKRPEPHNKYEQANFRIILGLLGFSIGCLLYVILFMAFEMEHVHVLGSFGPQVAVAQEFLANGGATKSNIVDGVFDYVSRLASGNNTYVNSLDDGLMAHNFSNIITKPIVTTMESSMGAGIYTPAKVMGDWTDNVYGMASSIAGTAARVHQVGGIKSLIGPSGTPKYQQSNTIVTDTSPQYVRGLAKEAISGTGFGDAVVNGSGKTINIVNKVMPTVKDAGQISSKYLYESMQGLKIAKSEFSEHIMPIIQIRNTPSGAPEDDLVLDNMTISDISTIQPDNSTNLPSTGIPNRNMEQDVKLSPATQKYLDDVETGIAPDLASSNLTIQGSGSSIGGSPSKYSEPMQGINVYNATPSNIKEIDTPLLEHLYANMETAGQGTGTELGDKEPILTSTNENQVLYSGVYDGSLTENNIIAAPMDPNYVSVNSKKMNAKSKRLQRRHDKTEANKKRKSDNNSNNVPNYSSGTVVIDPTTGQSAFPVLSKSIDKAHERAEAKKPEPLVVNNELSTPVDTKKRNKRDSSEKGGRKNKEMEENGERRLENADVEADIYTHEYTESTEPVYDTSVPDSSDKTDIYIPLFEPQTPRKNDDADTTTLIVTNDENRTTLKEILPTEEDISSLTELKLDSSVIVELITNSEGPDSDDDVVISPMDIYAQRLADKMKEDLLLSTTQAPIVIEGHDAMLVNDKPVDNTSGNKLDDMNTYMDLLDQLSLDVDDSVFRITTSANAVMQFLHAVYLARANLVSFLGPDLSDNLLKAVFENAVEFSRMTMDVATGAINDMYPVGEKVLESYQKVMMDKLSNFKVEV